MHNCRGFQSADPPPGSVEKASLLPLLETAASRLNSILQPQPSFTPTDVIHVGHMCGYDSAAAPRESGWSKWCNVLSRDEWEAVGHIADAERWYAVGEGSVSARIRCEVLTADLRKDHGSRLRERAACSTVRPRYR